MDSEEEALFRAYPYALYFVQSPSTVSHSNSADLRGQSPIRSENFMVINNPTARTSQEEATRLALSRYSSSRGSNNSFLHEKKIAYDLQSHGHHEADETDNGEKCHVGVDVGVEDYGDDEEEEEERDYFGRKGGWWKYFTFRHSSSFAWICLQISWRLMVSLGVALLVFYIAAKPPSPKISIKIGRIHQFRLGEGVDASGVATKILSCNCSMDLVIDNNSQIFGLHIDPPALAMSFGNLPLAISHGTKLYAESDGSRLFKLYVGTTNKPMYGAGRSMQDMLDSGKGLPLVIRMSLRSSFHVVPNLIEPKFHHQAECLLVLDSAYDKRQRTQAYSSKCTPIL
ncbi:hypothetical protein RJ639_047098 [Escallonia herrerae]|uniref:Late embryogenesis abundant protein LEA-2 subgroup domain-containing protein n=1 Tax=Escallonia herrerae TaxID=1293975 RepID=A0AA88W6W8_9ASTE|nr:hypothetical protein RJ639_047098 [Escallonia herrerae]